MPTASDSLLFLCLCEWTGERRGLTPINISLTHIVNGFNTYKRLHSAQHDCVIELIATAVREVLQRDAIMLKHSPVMHEWVDISRNLFYNTVNTEERGWGEVSDPVVVLPRHQQLHGFMHGYEDHLLRWRLSYGSFFCLQPHLEVNADDAEFNRRR